MRIWKLSGSGNDFVFLDATTSDLGDYRDVGSIIRLCDRRQGVGADGVVFLEAAAAPAAFRMAYFNSDGTRASMCGNAALCSVRLATELGIAPASGFIFESDAGRVGACLREGLPEVDLAPMSSLVADVAIATAADEQRIGFVRAGVPHIVVLCADVERVPFAERGPVLRHDPSVGSAGANANFVSRNAAGSWSMRTFERGVEGETLACGTGAIACAALLGEWGLSDTGGTTLTTRSGRPLGVHLRRSASGEVIPSLRGEGRIVFTAKLGDLRS